MFLFVLVKGRKKSCQKASQSPGSNTDDTHASHALNIHQLTSLKGHLTGKTHINSNKATEL